MKVPHTTVLHLYFSLCGFWLENGDPIMYLVALSLSLCVCKCDWVGQETRDRYVYVYMCAKESNLLATLK